MSCCFNFPLHHTRTSCRIRGRPPTVSVQQKAKLPGTKKYKKKKVQNVQIFSGNHSKCYSKYEVVKKKKRLFHSKSNERNETLNLQQGTLNWFWNGLSLVLKPLCDLQYFCTVQLLGFGYFLLKVQYMHILEKTFKKLPKTIDRMCFGALALWCSVQCVAVTSTEVSMLTSSPRPVPLRSCCGRGVDSNALISQAGPRLQEGHQALKPTSCSSQTVTTSRDDLGTKKTYVQ